MTEDIKEKLLEHFKRKAEIARFLGVNRQAVNNWFATDAYPCVRSSIKLADAIGVDWLEIRDDMR